jgi:hypothetical protein
VKDHLRPFLPCGVEGRERRGGGAVCDAEAVSGSRPDEKRGVYG